MQPSNPTEIPPNQPQTPQYPPIQPQPPTQQPMQSQPQMPPQPQFQPQQAPQSAYQQSVAFPQQMQSSSSKKPLLIVVIIVALVTVLGGAAFAFLGGKDGNGALPGTGVIGKVAGGGVKLKDYTSQGAKFQMKLPDGADITDEQNPYDQNLHTVRAYGPQQEGYDYTTQIGRSIDVTYEHQTDAARHKTSYADYLKNVKEDASSMVRHSDESYKTVMDKEEETTVAGHKAYIAQTSTTDGKDGSKHMTKMVYVYIDELTVYNLEFQVDTSDAAFINQIDAMIKSFKTL